MSDLTYVEKVYFPKDEITGSMIDMIARESGGFRRDENSDNLIIYDPNPELVDYLVNKLEVIPKRRFEQEV